MSRRVKPIRAVLVALALLLAAPAAALADCGTSILSDYLDDGKISGSYSQSCYSSALNQIPPDLEVYTDVRAAIQAAKNRAAGGSGSNGGTVTPPPPATTTKARPKPSTTGATTDGGTTTDLAPVLPGTTTDAGIVGEALKDIGPKKADEVPLPVIILGGLAGLLILAGAGGLIAQRMARRKRADDGPGEPETAV